MGVTVDIAEQGDGQNFPKKNDVVIIHYDGYLLDASKPDKRGDKFDSSRDRKEPFRTEIGVGKVIKGWDEGIPQLSKGAKARLTITPDYGYGARGFPPVIPANSTLIFEVELIDIN
ncbi:Peptidylprolyl isomerase [Favolaschia claudopus]|uniref:peptidylprolyl isomerase n=1 Tax=Favolaschia claudopus TaxID=2862362 RepID=A0AAW0CE18_9AGAR